MATAGDWIGIVLVFLVAYGAILFATGNIRNAFDCSGDAPDKRTTNSWLLFGGLILLALLFTWLIYRYMSCTG